MGVGKVMRVVFGAVLALLAIGLLIGGGTLLWAYETQRNADGFFVAPTADIEASGYAIVTSKVDLASHAGAWWPAETPGTIRLSVRSTDDREVFVGIAAEQQVAEYLTNMAYDEVRDISGHPAQLHLVSHTGSAPSALPDDESFWVARVQGSGTQTVTWDLEQGSWTAVIMNADASAPLSLSVVASGRFPIVRSVAIGLLAAGIILTVLAALLLAARRQPTGQMADQPFPSSTASATPDPYPAALEASLDTPLSPALWLVKWFLVIPHYVVLAFLWAALVLLTGIAWFAILFTGRYPKGIFKFNEGVIRWTWRVAFYAYSGLGTDRYPPFTLHDTAYPARFSVEYPEQLSRGLALVKWWLLAIPHYIIVGALTSGIILWSSDTACRCGTASSWEAGIGFLGALVLVAGFTLLFTGRYPRGLFDLIVGLNRWAFRLLAYVALMTDEYPPFRLDMGEHEPQNAP